VFAVQELLQLLDRDPADPLEHLEVGGQPRQQIGTSGSDPVPPHPTEQLEAGCLSGGIAELPGPLGPALPGLSLEPDEIDAEGDPDGDIGALVLADPRLFGPYGADNRLDSLGLGPLGFGLSLPVGGSLGLALRVR